MCFAGESDHCVGADCGVGHGFAYLSNFLRIVPWPILAMHGAKNMVTAGLQRQMRVLGDSGGSRHQRDQLISPVHRLDRAATDFLNVCMAEQSAHKLLKPHLGSEITSPAG